MPQHGAVMNILCKMRGHLPDRGGARHDGQDYWTACKRCAAPLIRDLDGWRPPTDHDVRAHGLNLVEQRGLSGSQGGDAASA